MSNIMTTILSVALLSSRMFGRHKQQPGGISVRMTVTANVAKDRRTPQIDKEDVSVRRGKERLDVLDWTPARGDSAGLKAVPSHRRRQPFALRRATGKPAQLHQRPAGDNPGGSGIRPQRHRGYSPRTRPTIMPWRLRPCGYRWVTPAPSEAPTCPVTSDEALARKPRTAAK